MPAAPNRATPSLFAIAVLAAACGAPAGEEVFDDESDDMDAFAATGKTDTGYVSDQAAEIEAELSSRVQVNVAALPAADRDRLLAAAQRNDRAAFSMYPTDQVKFARNVLKKERFNANIESAAANITRIEIARDRGSIWLDYNVTVESLVKNKDLPAGTTVQALVGRTVSVRLPADPKNAHVTGGLACATDPDDPASTDIQPQPHNYFYYWNPDKAGCPISATAQAATFRVKNLAPAKNTYPEFDRLLADKKVSLVAVFGQLDYGALSDDDWGWAGYDDLEYWLKAQKFRKVRTVNGTPLVAGARKEARSQWTRAYSTGFTMDVTVISPLELQSNADQARKDAVFLETFQKNEIIYYNGHSFYGSLKVLEKPENFSAGYQIVFMDSCWSYAYYTKQVFSSKATAADATGMLNADVINNTEVAMSGSHETFFVWLQKLNTAANFVARGQPSKAKNYTWKNLIQYMNADAKRRFTLAQREGDTEHKQEIYGASGVTTNRWTSTAR